MFSPYAERQSLVWRQAHLNNVLGLFEWSALSCSFTGKRKINCRHQTMCVPLFLSIGSSTSLSYVHQNDEIYRWFTGCKTFCSFFSFFLKQLQMRFRLIEKKNSLLKGWSGIGLIRGLVESRVDLALGDVA